MSHKYGKQVFLKPYFSSTDFLEIKVSYIFIPILIISIWKHRTLCSHQNLSQFLLDEIHYLHQTLKDAPPTQLPTSKLTWPTPVSATSCSGASSESPVELPLLS